MVVDTSRTEARRFLEPVDAGLEVFSIVLLFLALTAALEMLRQNGSLRSRYSRGGCLQKPLVTLP
jgi:hypothetical protein